MHPVCSFSRTRSEVRSRYWARNKAAEFVSLNIFLYPLRIFFILLCATVYSCKQFPFISRGQKGNPNPILGREIQRTLTIYFSTIFAGGWGWDGGYTTFPGFERECGRASEQAIQSGSTRTPSLAVEVVAVAGSTYLADATHLPGRRRLARRPQEIG